MTSKESKFGLHRENEQTSLFAKLLRKHSPELRALGLVGLITMLAACERGEQNLGEIYTKALESKTRKVHVDMPRKNTQDLVGLQDGMRIQKNGDSILL